MEVSDAQPLIHADGQQGSGREVTASGLTREATPKSFDIDGDVHLV
jgi:hypothetical protein